jgi:hypothetical protein
MTPLRAARFQAAQKRTSILAFVEKLVRPVLGPPSGSAPGASGGLSPRGGGVPGPLVRGDGRTDYLMIINSPATKRPKSTRQWLADKPVLLPVEIEILYHYLFGFIRR